MNGFEELMKEMERINKGVDSLIDTINEKAKELGEKRTDELCRKVFFERA